MPPKVNYSGLVVAAVGFFLTRFTVTLAVYDDPRRFYFAGVVPLVLGLGLAAFGVALAVGHVDRDFVRTTAVWCLVGTAAMLVLVVLTLLGASAGGMPDLVAVRSRTYLANFLIGGSIGGTLTGLYAARTRQQRQDLRQHANRLEVLNRLLRHEVLNSLTAIRGYAALGSASDRAEEVVDRQTTAIQKTIEEVDYLTHSASGRWGNGVPVEVGTCLQRSVASVRERHPAATVDVEGDGDGIRVVANERVERVFTHLIENAVVHGGRDAPTVEVSISATANSVRVSVTDTGPGLPAEQRRLLERGDIGDFDDPRAGFGLNVVRLLVESYRGSIETTVTEAGSTITVVLPRAATAGTGIQATPSDVTTVRVSPARLVVTVGAALIAGAIMGVATGLLGGSVPVIGTLYGVESSVVGWITHEFHSVVFGFVFVGLLASAPARVRGSPVARVGLGVAWALVLWAVAGGVVMPVWLNLVGIPVPVPTFATTPLVTHVVWGLSMGVLVSGGDGRVTRRLSTLRGAFPSRPGAR